MHISPEALRAELEGPDPPVVLDVRDEGEIAGGRLPGSLHVPLEALTPARIAAIPSSARIVTICARGPRAEAARTHLLALGWADVRATRPGFERWRELGFPVEGGSERYQKHLLLPEVGVRGQARLREAKILVVGAGGLGSPCLLYLAAAGAGTLGVADHDAVDVSNLQRQILHTTAAVGTKKTRSAERAIRALNPDVDVVVHDARVTAANAEAIVRGYGVVVDATDNFDARYALADAALRLRVPLVHGAVHRFSGQVTTFIPGEGPCYRCLFAAPPPPDAAPSCGEIGVLGAVCGVVGTLQATEALKLVLGIGDPLVGRLLLFDALSARTTEVLLERDPACPACGPHKRTEEAPHGGASS